MLVLSSFGLFNSIVVVFFVYLFLYLLLNRKYLQNFPTISFVTFYVFNFLILIYKKKFLQIKISIEDVDRNIYLLLLCLSFSFLLKFFKLLLKEKIDISQINKNLLVKDTSEENLNNKSSKELINDKNNEKVSKVIINESQEEKNQIMILNVKIDNYKNNESSEKDIKNNANNTNSNSNNMNNASANNINNIKTYQEDIFEEISDTKLDNNDINIEDNSKIIAKNIKNSFKDRYSNNFLIKNKQEEIMTLLDNSVTIDLNLKKYLDVNFVKKNIFEEKINQVHDRIDSSIEDNQNFVDKITHFIKIINSELKKK